MNDDYEQYGGAPISLKEKLSNGFEYYDNNGNEVQNVYYVMLHLNTKNKQGNRFDKPIIYDNDLLDCTRDTIDNSLNCNGIEIDHTKRKKQNLHWTLAEYQVISDFSELLKDLPYHDFLDQPYIFTPSSIECLPKKDVKKLGKFLTIVYDNNGIMDVFFNKISNYLKNILKIMYLVNQSDVEMLKETVTRNLKLNFNFDNYTYETFGFYDYGTRNETPDLDSFWKDKISDGDKRNCTSQKLDDSYFSVVVKYYRLFIKKSDGSWQEIYRERYYKDHNKPHISVTNRIKDKINTCDVINPKISSINETFFVNKDLSFSMKNTSKDKFRNINRKMSIKLG